jgi:integrase
MSSQTRRSPSYLIRNPYSYCFRMFVPKDLQPYIGRKELRYSLKTGYLSTAKYKARIMAGQVQRIFKFLRKGNKVLEKLSDNQIQEIVQKYLKSYIDSIEERMYSDKLLPFGVNASAFYQYIDTLGEIKQDIIVDLGVRDYSTVVSIVDDLFKENGIENIDKSSITYQKLCRGILRAQLKGIDIEKKQMLGDYSDDKYIDSPIALKETTKDSDSKLLSKVIGKYVSEVKVQWKPKTESTHMATLKLFEEIIGDVPIQTITRKRVGEFKDVLKKLPPNIRKVKKYRDKTISQILQMNIKKTLATQTINNHLQRVCSMFEYACINGLYDGPNPASKMQLPMDKSSGDSRASFTPDELNKLFRSEQYLDDTFEHPFQFWTPIIALFQGMRQNEIAQLYLSDIRESEDGIWIFDLNEDAEDKSIKTKSSRRLVPIHPFILNELNLLKYCEILKSKGEQRLFPEISWQRDGYGKRVSEWFNGDYKKECGIADVDGRKKDYHSFRKTFTTDMFYKKLPRDLRLRIVGHSIGRDETSKTYVEDFPSKQFYDEIISKIDFEKQIDLSHLKNSKYAIKE